MPDSFVPLHRQRRGRLARSRSFRQLSNGRPVDMADLRFESTSIVRVAGDWIRFVGCWQR